MRGSCIYILRGYCNYDLIYVKNLLTDTIFYFVPLGLSEDNEVDDEERRKEGQSGSSLG